MIKNYYNQHRRMLSNEFRKKFDKESDSVSKQAVKNDFRFFMKKMDSIENVALVGALLKVKNLEDLKKINDYPQNSVRQSNEITTVIVEKTADYPGGINSLRKEVADLFYSDGVYSESTTLKTVVAFVVEKDGKVSDVKAEGENFTFNRQAEIALYSLSGTFIPGQINGVPVRSRFRFPLSINFE